jgi:adenylosuccinate lyase
MIENMNASYGLVFSQPVLLALVEAGQSRDDAYRVVQRNALRTWEERRPFIEVLREDPDITKTLTEQQLAACFDLKRAIANVGRTFEILDQPIGDAFSR